MRSGWSLYQKIRAHIVLPSADSTANTYISEVVGNKTDAAVTTVGTTKSLVAYAKGILNQLATIITNISNVTVQETAVTTAGTIAQDGTTGAPNVVQVATSTSANTFGDWTALDAVAAVDCWVSHVMVCPVVCASGLCVEIGTGASPITKIRFSIYSSQLTAVGHYPVVVFALPIPIKVASGTAISARTSAVAAGAINVQVGISYYIGLE